MQDFGGASSDDPGGFRGERPGGDDDPGPDASVLGLGQLLLAETLGLAMARRAADILDRHRDAVTQAALAGDPGEAQRDASAGADVAQPVLDIRQFALDDAVFTAVLDATNDCLSRFDSRPPAERWCDALLHLLDLARYGGDPR